MRPFFIVVPGGSFGLLKPRSHEVFYTEKVNLSLSVMQTITTGHSYIQAYSAMSALGASRTKPAMSGELEAIQQRISRTHLQGAAFQRLLGNTDLGIARLETLLKAVVWSALDAEGIDADAAVLVRAGEPGYGWTNGGWLLAQLEEELRQLFGRARVL
jgi:hypothetical protein